METPKSKLDTIANIAIIVVCIIAAVVLVQNQILPRFQHQPARPSEAAKGETLAALRDVVPAGTQKALVMAISPTCHFCTDSMPFYKQLLDKRNQSQSPLKVIAAVPDAKAEAAEQANLAEHGVQPDALVHVDFSKIKVPGTPTLLLVDDRGKVLNVWVGKLDESREREVLAQL